MAVVKVYSPLLVNSSVKAPQRGDQTAGGSATVLGPSTPMFKDGVLFGHNLMRVLHFNWNFSRDGGADAAITLNSAAGGYVIPANAIVWSVLFNPTTAPVGAGASISFGTSAGSSATALKAVTAITSFTIDALVAGAAIGTAATAFKMSAAGAITMTPSTAVLTAGLIEGWVTYFEAANA